MNRSAAARPIFFHGVAPAKQCPGWGAPARGTAAGVCGREGPLWGLNRMRWTGAQSQASYTWDHQRAPCSAWGLPRKEPGVQAAVLTPNE